MENPLMTHPLDGHKYLVIRPDAVPHLPRLLLDAKPGQLPRIYFRGLG